jgi:MFS superfamily sulfate permease-like transporter
MTFKWFTVDMIIFCFVPARWITKLGLPARKVNRTDVLIIIGVMIISIPQICWWGNLFYAVVIGIGASIVVFILQVLFNGGSLKYIWRAFTSHPAIYLSKKRLDDDGTMIYVVRGPLFFATVRTFVTLFEPQKETASNVIIYLEDGRIYDYSSLEGLSKVCKAFKTAGKFVNVMGLTESSQNMIRVSSGTANLSSTWFTTWCSPTCLKNLHCCKKFSLGWFLGDIEIAGEELHANKNSVILRDLESTPSSLEYEKGDKFLINSAPDSYVFT